MSDKLTFLASKKNALLLGIFAAICTALVSLTYVLTAPIIEQQEKQQTLKKINQVLVSSHFDNNPLENCVMISAPEITGSINITPIYRATRQNQPYALVFQTQTKQGYNGLIKLLASVDTKGEVQGVRTLIHQETPGLGDKIELTKSDWILGFNQQQIKDENDKRWFVKKDGGAFDQFTGATITPRAVVNQLRTSIAQVNQKFEQIFALENQCNSNLNVISANNAQEANVNDN